MALCQTVPLTITTAADEITLDALGGAVNDEFSELLTDHFNSTFDMRCRIQICRATNMLHEWSWPHVAVIKD